MKASFFCCIFFNHLFFFLRHNFSTEMLRYLSRPGQLLTTARFLSVAAESSSSANKEALMKLRKRTGYSYVNCRKALLQFGPDELDEAVKWLQELAKKEGWAKAAKLSTRSTFQGLIGFANIKNAGAVVELLCETDFVARGDNFKALLEKLTLSAAEQASKELTSSEDGKIKTASFELEHLLSADGHSMKEVVTMTVGKLGENITVKRIIGYIAPAGASLYGAAHPKEGTDKVAMGKFISVIAMQRAAEGVFCTETLALQICQHIIGMRSNSLGEPPVKQENVKEVKKSEKEEDELNDFYEEATTQIDEDETALLRQSFMLNPSQTVYEYLVGHKAEVIDFARIELGAEKE